MRVSEVLMLQVSKFCVQLEFTKASLCETFSSQNP